MRMRIAIALAFTTNTILGGFCMMPMAMAAEMPAHDMGAMEDTMTPMSQPDCPHCDHAKEEKQSEKPKGMPCDGEHCLSHSAPTTLEAVQTTSAPSAVIPVALTPIAFVVPLGQGIRPISTAPPNTAIRIQTVVLRF